MTLPKKRNYDWVPDFPDSRDYRYAVTKPIPSKADLRAGCSRVEDQGPIGSCTANALAGTLEFLERRAGKAFIEVSRLFIYYNERASRGTVNRDAGATLRDGIKALAKFGACSETLWPYEAKLVFEKPTASAYARALEHRIQDYRRLSSLNEMRACLASGSPFVFGFKVFSGFESQAVAETGILEMPSSEETFLGGHAVVAVGYEDTQQRLVVRNSWGENWGMRGYFTMPYEYVVSPSLSADFWTIDRF